MIHRHTRTPSFLQLGLISLLLVITAVTGATVERSRKTHKKPTGATSIQNFGKVNQNYYRGSQPTEAEIGQLKAMGIKSVIDLRKDNQPEERSWVEGSGMRYFNIPLKSSEAAADEKTNHFLQLVNDPQNWPVFVHCKGGRHRTGALTAVYRITHDGWTAEEAFREMKEYEFEHGFFGGPSAQKKYVFSYYEQHRAHTSAK
jgi:tyrosine-protein phosphatase SIW14